MADNFGLKIGIEGEKEFKNAIREINQSFKVLGSEMNLVASQFDKQDKSVEAVIARNKVLNKEIELQKEKIATLEKALANAASSFGETDKRTQSWQIQLNNAKAELNKMERELEQSAESADELGDELKESGDNAENPARNSRNWAVSLKVLARLWVLQQPQRARLPSSWEKRSWSSLVSLSRTLAVLKLCLENMLHVSRKQEKKLTRTWACPNPSTLPPPTKWAHCFRVLVSISKKSLELTEKAMQRAADMASVMGIDMQTAMESIAGAARVTSP